jgi:hypothetical protein
VEVEGGWNARCCLGERDETMERLFLSAAALLNVFLSLLLVGIWYAAISIDLKASDISAAALLREYEKSSYTERLLAVAYIF